MATCGCMAECLYVDTCPCKTGQTGSRPGVTAFYMYIRLCQETISHDQEYAHSPFVDSAPLLWTVRCLWELDVHSDVMMMYSAGGNRDHS